MSHELRSPPHAIVGFAELLAEEIEGAWSPEGFFDVGVAGGRDEHLAFARGGAIDGVVVGSGVQFPGANTGACVGFHHTALRASVFTAQLAAAWESAIGFRRVCCSSKLVEATIG